MYVYDTDIYPHLYLHLSIYFFIYVCIYLYMYVRMYIYISLSLCVHIFIYHKFDTLCKKHMRFLVFISTNKATYTFTSGVV